MGREGRPLRSWKGKNLFPRKRGKRIRKEGCSAVQRRPGSILHGSRARPASDLASRVHTGPPSLEPAATAGGGVQAHQLRCSGMRKLGCLRNRLRLSLSHPGAPGFDGCAWPGRSALGGPLSGRRCVDEPVSYTHLRAHETKANLVCRLLLEKKKTKKHNNK